MTSCGSGGDGTGATTSTSAGRGLIYLWRVGDDTYETLDAQVGRNVILPFYFDGGGSVLTVGSKLEFHFPDGGDNYTIVAVSLLSDIAGSVVIDVWKDTYDNFPPTVADTITASAKPTLSSGRTYKDTTLTGWTTAISADDTLIANIDSVSTLTRVGMFLHLRRSVTG